MVSVLHSRIRVTFLVDILVFVDTHLALLYMSSLQTMFGSPPTSPASSKKTFAFLIKFLTDVVPFETALYLKVGRYKLVS